MYIPIGKNCLVAGQLDILKLREVALPFDWLLIKDQYIFIYLNDLINTKFENFTKNLLYNDRNVVISEKYPFCEFLHQDLNNLYPQYQDEFHNLHSKILQIQENYIFLQSREL